MTARSILRRRKERGDTQGGEGLDSYSNIILPHAVCSQIASVFHQYFHYCYRLLTSAHQQSSRDGMSCPPAAKALSLHLRVHEEDYQHISSWYDRYPL